MQNCVLFFSSLNSRKTDNELALCIIHRLLIVLYYEDATAKKKSDDTDGICNNEKENDEEGDDLPSPTSMPNATKSQSKKAELKKSITYFWSTLCGVANLYSTCVFLFQQACVFFRLEFTKQCPFKSISA